MRIGGSHGKERQYLNPMNIGVIASHEGTNLQAVIDACESGALQANVSVVISNNSGSGALQRAKRHAIPFCHLSSATHPDTTELDQATCRALEKHEVDVVLLAGYMRKLGPHTLKEFQGRVLNTHPALLPKFGGQGMYGRRVHEAVLAAGEAISGVSIHIVDEEYDTGPVIAQCEVPVAAEDTVDSLTERIRTKERAFVVQTLQQIADGSITLPAG